MTQKHIISRKLRRVFIKGPKKVKMVFKKRKHSKQKCGNCGKHLGGTIRERPYKMRTTAKTKKRPTRKFGGVLCPECTKKELKKRIRS